MKILIPKNYSITDKSLTELKQEVKKLLDEYDEKTKEYKIYLYSNFLRIKYLNNYYNVTIVEKDNELFWYLKPFYNSYFLLKKTHTKCFDIILLIIKSIT